MPDAVILMDSDLVVQKLAFDIPVPGLASTLAMISPFGGVQLLCIGLIGEYVGKTLMGAKRRPTYVIASRTLQKRLAPGDVADGKAIST